MKHERIKPGDVCEIVDLHPKNAFYHMKERFIGKRVVVEKIYNEYRDEMWLDVDLVLMERAYPFKGGREVPFYKVMLRKILIN